MIKSVKKSATIKAPCSSPSSKTNAGRTPSESLHSTPRPKREFLRRGEGVHRRVYFAKYKEEARIAREERKIASSRMVNNNLANISSDKMPSQLETQGKSFQQEYYGPSIEHKIALRPDVVLLEEKKKQSGNKVQKEEEELAGESVLLAVGEADEPQSLGLAQKTKKLRGSWESFEGEEDRQEGVYVFSKGHEEFEGMESRLHPFKAASQSSGAMEGLVGFLDSSRDVGPAGSQKWEKRKVLLINALVPMDRIYYTFSCKKTDYALSLKPCRP